MAVNQKDNSAWEEAQRRPGDRFERFAIGPLRAALLRREIAAEMSASEIAAAQRAATAQ